MRNDLADITLILDRSGSMTGTLMPTINGVNGFLDSQAEVPGEALITMAQFDDEDPFEIICRGEQVAKAPRLSTLTYVPRGWTPLLDAIGRGIVDTGVRLAKMEEAARPGKVIFVIVTDGLENRSVEFTHAKIREMITVQRDVYKWEFVFIGADIETMKQGIDLGTQAANTAAAVGGMGVQAAYLGLASNARSYRVGSSSTMGWSDKQRAAMGDTPKKAMPKTAKRKRRLAK